MSARIAARRVAIPLPVTAALGAALAILAGYACYEPTLPVLAPLALAIAFGVLAFVVRAPRVALGALIATTMMLIVFVVTNLRAVNAFDLLMPVLLGWTFFAYRRRMAVRPHQDDALSSDAPVLGAAKRLQESTVWYFGAAVLSLGILWHDLGARAAGDSGLILFRAIQGVLMFSLGLAWIRSRRDVQGAFSAFFAGGVLFVVVNAIGVMFWKVPRAGLTWILNMPEWPITSPNEAAVAALMLAVVLVIRQQTQPRARNVVLLVSLVVMLVLTLSRSGLLAWLSFGLFFLPKLRWPAVGAAVLGVGLAVLFVPDTYWSRLARTVAVERGSFEAFTVIERLYAWKSAMAAFLDRPITGHGYLSFRYISHHYNDLQFVIGQVENYFLEMAVSMGLIGLFLLAIVIADLYRLGHVIRARVPAASTAGRMARYHAPLITALLVGNMTGDNFVSMVLLAQLAIWCAILVRAAQADLAAEGR